MTAKKTKLLHVVTGTQVGGAEIMMCRVLENLSRDRFESVCVSLAPEGPLAGRIRAAGIPLISLGMGGAMSLPAGLAKLVRVIRQERPDAVQTWMYHADFLGGLAARLCGVPAIWNIQHSTHDDRGIKRSTRALTALLANLSRLLPKKIVCCAEASVEAHAAGGYDAGRMVTIYNGADTRAFAPDGAAAAAFRAAHGIPPEAPVIGAAGRFHPQKDYPTFFEAALRLQMQRPDAHFVACGFGVEATNPAIAPFLARSPKPENFHLLGARADMAAIYPAFTIFTLCAAFGEGFPLCVGEAMASGLPCATTEAGDCREIVGTTGRVVAKREPRAMAAAWGELLRLPADDLAALGRAARERIAIHFSLPRSIRQYEALYAEVAAAPPKSAAPLPAQLSPAR